MDAKTTTGSAASMRNEKARRSAMRRNTTARRSAMRCSTTARRTHAATHAVMQTVARKTHTPRKGEMLARTNMHAKLRTCARATMACVLSVCMVLSSSGVAWALETSIPASSTQEHYFAGQSPLFSEGADEGTSADAPQPVLPLNETGGGSRSI